MFFLAPAAPITINMMTMYAMILVIGILVDDGIIIGENIIRKFELGLNRYDAAVEGTMEVFQQFLLVSQLLLLHFYLSSSLKA